MLNKFIGTVSILAITTLTAVGCGSSKNNSTGTGGAIGTGTGGAASTGTGGTTAGTGGDMGTGGSAGGSTGLAGMTGVAGSTGVGGGGGAGGMLSASDQNKAIINAPAATGVTALDPSIAGTPKTYMTGGVCQ